MRRLLPLCTVLLLLASPAAHAAPGVNLRWTNCLGDGGTFNRNFACNTNSGSNVLVGSFVLAQARAQITGVDAIVDVATANASLPSWWALWNAGSCRQGAMTVNAAIHLTAVNCVDWAQDQASIGVVTYTMGLHGPASARIRIVSGVAPANVQDLFASEEYFAFHVSLSNAKTVGTGACAGCTVPVCLRFASIKLASPLPANNDVTVSGATNGTDSHLVTWQNGSAVCLAATPARTGTWGELKSLYR